MLTRLLQQLFQAMVHKWPFPEQDLDVTWILKKMFVKSFRRDEFQKGLHCMTD